MDLRLIFLPPDLLQRSHILVPYVPANSVSVETGEFKTFLVTHQIFHVVLMTDVISQLK